MTKQLKINGYDVFLDEIKTTITDTRIRTMKVVNTELIQLYWSIGRSIAEKQENEGWGKAVVEKLAKVPVKGILPPIVIPAAIPIILASAIPT